MWRRLSRREKKGSRSARLSVETVSIDSYIASVVRNRKQNKVFGVFMIANIWARSDLAPTAITQHPAESESR